MTARNLILTLVMLCATAALYGARWNADSLRRIARNPQELPTNRLNALSKLEFMSHTSNLDSAFFLSDSLGRMAVNLADSGYLHRSLYKKSDIFLRRLEIDSAIFYLKIALKMAQKLNMPSKEADDWCTLGSIYEDRGDLEHAIEYYQKCGALGEMAQSERLIARSKLNLGSAYRTKGDLMVALDILLQARKICEAKNFTGYYAFISMNIGDIHQSLENIEKAEAAYERGAGEAKAVGNRIRYAQLLIRLANAQALLGKEKTALQNLEECLTIGSSMGIEAEQADAEIRIAQILLRQGKLKEANLRAKSSMTRMLTFGDSLHLPRAYEVLGSIALAQKRPQQAVNHCRIGKRISIERQDIQQLTNNCFCLYKAFEQLNNPGSALTAYREYNKWQDSLINIDKSTAIARREAREQYERISYQDSILYRAELDFQQRVFQEKEASQSLRFSIAVGVMLAILLIALVLIVLTLNIRKKNRLLGTQKEEIEANTKIISQALSDKEVLLREIHHRVKNNLQVINSLLGLQAMDTHEPEAKAALRESQNRINSMSLIHNMLYQSMELSAVLMDHYILALWNELTSVFANDKTVKLELQANNIELDVDHAVPLGLILTELITNAYKYAFVGTVNPCMHISLNQGTKQYHLLIRDNGPGIPESALNDESKSLGLPMVRGLVYQMGGQIEIRNDSGTTINIRFS